MIDLEETMLSDMSLSRRFLVVFLMFSSTLLFTEMAANAHSGGTDKWGCHSGSQAYHCHTASGSDGNPQYSRAVKHFLEKDDMYTRKGVKVKKYSSCLYLNRKYIGGVAVSSKKAKPIFLMKISRLLYLANKKLDLNKDGVACGLLEPENALVPTFSCIGDIPASTIPESTTTLPTIPTTTTTLWWMPNTTSTSIPSSNIVPCGSSKTITDRDGDWSVQVTAITPDAEIPVMAKHPDNQLAEFGKKYVIFTIRGTNLMRRTRMFMPDLLFDAQTPSGKTFNDLDVDHSCGIPPDGDTIVKGGGTVTEYFCLYLETNQTQNLRLVEAFPEPYGRMPIYFNTDPWAR